MSISRSFLLMGSLYLLVGVSFGMYMGGTGDHTLAPVHAHINLLGFTLMTLFGLAYLVIPSLAEGGLAKAHFWLHQIGALALLVGLYLLISGRVAESAIGPVLGISEGAVFLGVLCWVVLIFRRAK